jgi:hypothetical protein
VGTRCPGSKAEVASTISLLERRGFDAIMLASKPR